MKKETISLQQKELIYRECADRIERYGIEAWVKPTAKSCAEFLKETARLMKYDG